MTFGSLRRWEADLPSATKQGQEVVSTFQSGGHRDPGIFQNWIRDGRSLSRESH